jgi:2-polyprenyl-3-methyl-5-hydroxy-6-metoxy-1,4-benzoquinol methylase
MPNVDLYDSSYGHYALTAYGEIRRETYGEDYGQTSWVTTEESYEIPKLLSLSDKSSVLEIGCGSGGYAVYLAKSAGCRILGLDINAEGIRTANVLAEQADVEVKAAFQQLDVSQPLPEKDDTFDSVYSNDVLCHVEHRAQVLANIFRVLKPGGRFLFSDALLIGGLVSHEEIAIRSSIGMYFFSPPVRMSV